MSRGDRNGAGLDDGWPSSASDTVAISTAMELIADEWGAVAPIWHNLFASLPTKRRGHGRSLNRYMVLRGEPLGFDRHENSHCAFLLVDVPVSLS